MLSKKERHDYNPFDELEKHTVIKKETLSDKKSIHSHVKQYLISEYNITKSLRIMLDYLFEINQVKKDYVFLNYENCMEITGIRSNTTISNCLNTFIEYGFIAKMIDVNGYFLNPKYFGNFDTFEIKTIFTTSKSTDEVSQEIEKNEIKNPLITEDHIEGEVVMLPFDPNYWD